MNNTRKARIGVVGVGHFLYWPQFDGLLDELKQKPVDFINYFSDKSKIIDLGYVDEIDSATTCLKKALASDLDALFIIMTTYATS